MPSMTKLEFQQAADALREKLATELGADTDLNVSVLLQAAFSQASRYHKTAPREEVNETDRALERFSVATINLMMNYAKQDLPLGFDRVPAH